MTPQEAISYIENFGWSTTRLGLDRTRQLLAQLGDPQKKLKFIHVAGSNGKGSTCAMLNAILRAAGYKVGLYISPYIQDFCERMQVNEQSIPEERLAALTEKVRTVADAMDDHPSQFELVTAIAMEYFYEEACDIVVLEVGMGGALDSTNVIDAPELALITNIGLEHTEYLGDTLEKIAATKAGIIKPGCHCLCYDGAPQVTEVVRRVCAERSVPLTCVDFSHMKKLNCTLDGQDILWRGTPYHLHLIGNHQLHNAALVLSAIEILRQRGWCIEEAAVEKGLAEVRWPARFEILSRDPLFILDGGHNPQCAQAMADCLAELFPGQKVTFLMGILADKDYLSVINTLLPFAKEFICVYPNNPRGLSARELRDTLTELGATAVACDTAEHGITTALDRAKGGVTVAFGSLYLAGEVRTVYFEKFRQ